MMKRLILAGLGALAVVTMMGSANAADMPRRHSRMPVKAPLYEPPLQLDRLLRRHQRRRRLGPLGLEQRARNRPTIDTSGGVVGGTIGYNYQMGQTVFGLEGDVDWSNIRGSTHRRRLHRHLLRNPQLLAGDRARPHRLRLRSLHALRHRRRRLRRRQGDGSRPRQPDHHASRLDRSAAASKSPIAGPWTAKIEYLYVDLGKGNCDAGDLRPCDRREL